LAFMCDFPASFPRIVFRLGVGENRGLKDDLL
jgi:hypothetical protein